MTCTPGTLEERLREAAADERVYAKEQDFWHEELLTEAADEIARLYSLARANNDLARRYADEIASLRARVEAVEMVAEEALDQLWHLAKDPNTNPLVLDLAAVLRTRKEPARQSLKDTPDAE